jgi:hypothetical protein
VQNSTTGVPILGGRTIFRIYRTSPVQRNAGHPFFFAGKHTKGQRHTSQVQRKCECDVPRHGGTLGSDSDDPPAALLATLHELRCARQRSVDDVAFDSVEEWNLVPEGGDWRTVCALCPPKRCTGKARSWKAGAPRANRTCWDVHKLTNHVERDETHTRVLNEVSGRCATSKPCGQTRPRPVATTLAWCRRSKARIFFQWHKITMHVLPHHSSLG